MRKCAFGLLLLLSLMAGRVVLADEIRLAVTTSFHNSGLSDVLLPAIRKDLGLEVHLLVVGTGQALKLGRAGDVDAILVHSKKAEQAFVKEGYGSHRREIMYNDFILVGPSTDPAGIGSAKSVSEAFRALRKAEANFVSRGDDSGTHRKEQGLWSKAGFKSDTFDSRWYRAAGAGMGASLNTASAMNAYILADRASWLNFRNKRELKLLFEGDPLLFNQYAFLPVSSMRHPHVKTDLALKLENWLAGPTGQKWIGEYQVQGERLFTPNASEKIPAAAPVRLTK